VVSILQSSHEITKCLIFRGGMGVNSAFWEKFSDIYQVKWQTLNPSWSKRFSRQQSSNCSHRQQAPTGASWSFLESSRDFLNHSWSRPHIFLDSPSYTLFGAYFPITRAPSMNFSHPSQESLWDTEIWSMASIFCLLILPQCSMEFGLILQRAAVALRYTKEALFTGHESTVLQGITGHCADLRPVCTI